MDSTELVQQLRSTFSAVLTIQTDSDMPVIIVQTSHLLVLISHLIEVEEFTFLTDLCGVHDPDQEKPLGVVYHLHHLPKNLRLRIKTFVSEQDPRIPSLTPLFESANWMERETYDFYGILFEGHPNLIRILNEDEMDYFPMRKTYALEDSTSTDKDDSMFGR